MGRNSKTLTGYTVAFKEYRVKLSQTGIAIPTVTANLDNSASIGVVYTRTSAGLYVATFTPGALSANKVTTHIELNSLNNISGVNNIVIFQAEVTSASVITIRTLFADFLISESDGVDDQLNDTEFAIRIWL